MHASMGMSMHLMVLTKKGIMTHFLHPIILIGNKGAIKVGSSYKGARKTKKGGFELCLPFLKDTSISLRKLFLS